MIIIIVIIMMMMFFSMTQVTGWYSGAEGMKAR